MPSWNVWSGKALSSKFDFRDDPSVASKVRYSEGFYESIFFVSVCVCVWQFQKVAKIFFALLFLRGSERKKILSRKAVSLDTEIMGDRGREL